MAPRIVPVETDTELPQPADVVIIGGGIIRIDRDVSGRTRR